MPLLSEQIPSFTFNSHFVIPLHLGKFLTYNMVLSETNLSLTCIYRFIKTNVDFYSNMKSDFSLI